MTRQGICGTEVESTTVDQFPCRKCSPGGHPDISVTRTDHRTSANVLPSCVLWSRRRRLLGVTLGRVTKGQFDQRAERQRASESLFSWITISTNLPSVFTRGDHHHVPACLRSDTPVLQETDHVLVVTRAAPFFAFVTLRSTLVHSCAVASLATFCVESPRLKAHAELIVGRNNTGWSYTCSLPYTTSTLRTYTHDNQHTLQHVFHNIDCGSLSFHRWQCRDSWRNTRTRRYLGLGHASVRKDSFFLDN